MKTGITRRLEIADPVQAGERGRVHHATPGNVSDLHFMGLNLHPKFVAVDKETNDDIMHLNRLGKAAIAQKPPCWLERPEFGPLIMHQ